MTVQNALEEMKERAFSPAFQEYLFDTYTAMAQADFPEEEKGYTAAKDYFITTLQHAEIEILSQIESNFKAKLQYAAQHAFHAGLYSGFSQHFSNRDLVEDEFEKHLMQNLFKMPGMQRHTLFFQLHDENQKLIQQLESDDNDERQEHLTSIECAWDQRVHWAACHSFYCGYRAAVRVLTAVDIVAIAEAGNISLAAKRLYISQPSLSSLLSHVEGEIGVLLFDRDTSPLKPTYAGEQYIAAAKQILGIQRNLDSHFADIRHGKQGRLVLGIGSKLLTRIFPKLLPVFLQHNPGIHIEIIEGNVGFLTEKLRSNEVDAVISNHVISLPNVSSRIISHQRMAIYTPRGLLTGLNANNDADFDLSLMRGEPFALVTTSYQREIINTIFLRYNISPNILIESSSWELCLSAVDHGLASTILPATSIHDDKESACRDTLILPEEYAFDTSVYYKARYYDTDLMKRFIQECVSLII